MRTTLSIDDHVLTIAKQAAALQHCSLGKFVEEALRQMLAGVTGQQARKHIDLPESGKGGLQPGVDIDNSTDLLFVMEESDDSYGC